MDSLLIEILSEEIPSEYQSKAKDEIAENLLCNIRETLMPDDQNLPYIEAYVTPIRLVFYIKNLNLSDISLKQGKRIRGPRINADSKAISGFLKKYKLKNVSDLEQEDEFYYYTEIYAKKDINLLLKEIIEKSITDFTWPKSMYWGDYDFKWVRPIHSIVCLLNDKIIPINIGHIIASNKTYGHKFMHNEEIKVNSPEDYFEKLKKAYVIISQEKREEIIKTEVEKVCEKNNLELLDDNKLLHEIVGLVEYPVVLLGKIEKEFMALPREVLVNTLKHHQRYMMLINENDELAPYFIIVANIEAKDGGKEIIKGNEKVLRARLYDAFFSIKYDQKKSLIDKREDLKRLSFHDEIGTVYDKTERVKEIAVKLARDMNLDVKKAERAAILMKNDLTTEMVIEFPALQGIMGYYYALYEGEDREVAEAIRDHYKPQGVRDTVPNTKLGAILALADKLDTLQEMFEINIKPTGSKDPYALRRAAIGISRIINSHKMILPLTSYGFRNDVLEFIKEKANNVIGDGSAEDGYYINESFF